MNHNRNITIGDRGTYMTKDEMKEYNHFESDKKKTTKKKPTEMPEMLSVKGRLLRGKHKGKHISTTPIKYKEWFKTHGTISNRDQKIFKKHTHIS